MTPFTSGSRASVAIVTGASRGLGLALARALAGGGWRLVIDARGGAELEAVRAELAARPGARAAPSERESGARAEVIALTGDVADEAHRRALVDAARRLGGLDLLVNNASLLGPSPQPRLADYPLEMMERVYQVNVLAPLRLVQLGLPLLIASRGRIVNVTSDAGVEAYEGWGGYGSSKAALEHLTRTLAAEHPDLRVFSVDPGDMDTRMQQEAFPGEDTSDRPPPEASVPGILRLVEGDRESGRYQARELSEAVRA